VPAPWLADAQRKHVALQLVNPPDAAQARRR
jgi:hypothetical protein